MLENPDTELHEYGHHDDLTRGLEQREGCSEQNSLNYDFYRMTPNPVQPIEALDRVVRCMKAPQKGILVEGAVQPVSEKVLDQYEQHDLNSTREIVWP